MENKNRENSDMWTDHDGGIEQNVRIIIIQITWKFDYYVQGKQKLDKTSS